MAAARAVAELTETGTFPAEVGMVHVGFFFRIWGWPFAEISPFSLRSLISLARCWP